MIWAQASVSFLVWCLFGVWAAKWALKRGVAPRPAMGALSMIGGALVLVVGLAGIGSAKGLVDGVLTLWAWFAVTLLGTLFVFLQAWGALAVASTAFRRETGTATDPSVAEKGPQ